MVRCNKDDKADCCGKCGTNKVAACIAVFGRLPLLKHTIERLYKKNKVDIVICVGHLPEDRKLCESLGAKWVHHRNRPLGDKWNQAFKEAKKYNVDACLFVGSSDWLSDNWLEVMLPLIEKYDLIGTLGCDFLHMEDSEFYSVRWPGYIKDRKGESIGIGRLISSKSLDRMQWQPFNASLDKSLDGSMQQSVNQISGNTHIIDNDKIRSLSISTDQWENKHKFWDHWSGKLPSERISFEQVLENFPEAIEIFPT